MQNLALPSHGGGADPRVRPALPSPVAVTGESALQLTLAQVQDGERDLAELVL